jgi:glycosyltransferase involved in cell wall biosynthesis
LPNNSQTNFSALKLSIITINLNNSGGLEKTIRSIVSQTFIDFEFLIIDGCSDDNSVEIITKYSDRINYWISEPDNGIYQAMNKGIKKSGGEYCFFLNSGDYFVNEKVLENVFEKEFKEDVVFGNLLVLLNNKIIGKSKGKDKISFIDVYSSLIKHQAAFMRRRLFDKFGLFNEELRIIADWEFFLKTVGSGGASYKYLDIDISCFDNNGLSNHNGPLILEERKKVIDKFIPSMMQPDYELLSKLGMYEKVIGYKLAHFILRLMAKGIKVYETICNRK